MKKIQLGSNQMSPHFGGIDGLRVIGKMMQFWRTPKLDPVFGTTHYKTFNLARKGLRMIAQTIECPKKVVGIPAFVCASVATPFLSEGWTVEWIDTNENGVPTVETVQKVIEKVGVLVLPHIFGQMYDRASIFDVAQEHEVLLVEDCAHHFDTNMTWCDVKLLSFGREKDLSCVVGGAVLWKSENEYTGIWADFEVPVASWGWVIRHGLQPLILGTAANLWHIGIGRVIAKIASVLKILPRAVTQAEKKGIDDLPMMQLAPSLGRVLEWQWKLRPLHLISAHKKADRWQKILEKKYSIEDICVPSNGFRVILKTKKADEVRKEYRKKGFDLRDWDGMPIAPAGVDVKAFGYEPGQCPGAERFMASYVTFPTNWRTKIMKVD